jgi:hypothetical protein
LTVFAVNVTARQAFTNWQAGQTLTGFATWQAGCKMLSASLRAVSGWTLFARWEFPSPFDHRICDGCAFLRNAFLERFNLVVSWKIDIIVRTTT